ncbi:hypothetical protein DSLASN_37070 [Desulfoluna limicola]|uniref:Uncharacterized protein n=1 Tax=Desulfoluna limicola TaxID=2810562 RepID=A0ABN6FBT5_9BACT|nr:hypothetical protein DSLASN_37070 [Desulfoluna limicola]
MRFNGLKQKTKKRLVLVKAIPVKKTLAQMPVGGVDDFHGCIVPNSVQKKREPDTSVALVFRSSNIEGGVSNAGGMGNPSGIDKGKKNVPPAARVARPL